MTKVSRKKKLRHLTDLLFTQSLTGNFFMMLDEPVFWNDETDKERTLDYVFDHQRITRANKAMLDQYGAKEEDFIGLTPNVLFAHDLEQGRDVWRKFFDEGTLHIDTREQRFDGGEMWVLGDYICIYDELGRIAGHFGVQIDITGRKNAEEQLRRYQEDLSRKNRLIQSILDNAPVGIWISDRNSAPVLDNRHALEHYALTEEERALCRKTDLHALSRNTPQHYNEIVTFKDGRKHFVQTVKTKLHEEDGSILGVLSIGLDMTDQREAEAALRVSEEKYRLLMEHTSDVIWSFDPVRERFTYISPSIGNLTGFTVEEALALPFDRCFDADSVKMLRKRIPKRMEEFVRNPESNMSFINELRQMCRDGTTIRVETSTRYRYNELKEIEIVGVTRNIEERKKAEEEILRLSFRDQLTGLYNRRFYEEELKRLDNPRNLPLTLVVADVNGLKLANDAFGHAAGDSLLTAFADILKRTCRRNDIVARTGGDEFVLIIPKTGETEAEKAVERICAEISAARLDPVELSVSFGQATKISPPESVEEIYKRAEDAMYRQKLLKSALFKSASVQGMADRLFQKNEDEREHSERVGELCRSIGKAMDMEARDVEELALAGMLHDIGKIGVKESVLKKTGAYSSAEYSEMKRHPETGFHILRSANDFAPIAPYVLAHHERMDGKGYPRGLTGEKIPLQARIIAVADAFDNMTRPWKHRRTMMIGDAVEELRRNAGKQFDAAVVKVFVEDVLSSSTRGDTP